MNWVAIGQLVIAAVLGSLGVAVVQHVLSPKTRAETRQIASSTARDTVQFSIQRLEADIKRAVERADAAETRADAAEKRSQVADLRADEADAKYDRVMAQNRILIEHIWRLSAWVNRYYDATNHPKGMEPPPRLEHAVDDGEHH